MPYSPGGTFEVEYLREAVVAAQHRTVSKEGDAHARVVQHHLLVAQSPAQAAVGVELCIYLRVEQ